MDHLTKRKITAKRLREIVLFDPTTGFFTWRIPRRKASVGNRVGTQDPRGYIFCKLEYRMYYAHRLAWLYMTGKWPTEQVDHIDRNKSNNAWNNLRLATQKQNCENMKLRNNNQLGVTGVNWSKRWKKWRARICHKRVTFNLGWFDSADLAIEARKKAELKYFTHSPLCGPPSGNL